MTVRLHGIAATVSLRHPRARVGDIHRNLEPHQGDAPSAERVIRLADADRHRHSKFIDLCVVPLVVEAQFGGDAREERIVVPGAEHTSPYRDAEPYVDIVERTSTAFLDRYVKNQAAARPAARRDRQRSGPLDASERALTRGISQPPRAS